MGVTEAIIIGSVLAAGTTAYSVDASNKARNDAKDQAAKMQADQDALTAQAAQKVAADNQAKDSLATAQKTRQNAILASQSAPDPIGMAQSNNNSGSLKTLLGS